VGTEMPAGLGKAAIVEEHGTPLDALLNADRPGGRLLKPSFFLRQSVLRSEAGAVTELIPLPD